MAALDFQQANDILRGLRHLVAAERARKVDLLRQLGLQPGQELVLLELAGLQQASQIELAQACEVDEPSMGRSLTRLERRGLVERAPDPTDSRRRLARLSTDGERVIPALRALYVQLATELVAGYPELAWLVEHLEEVSARFGRQPLSLDGSA